MNQHEQFVEFEKSFWQLSRKLSYIWRNVYEQIFPGSQSYILFTLKRSGPVRMSELANSLHLTPGAVTTASDKLIEQGYITRTRDKSDRRVVQLEITKHGASTLDELQSKGRKIIKSMFKDISEAELEVMHSIFKQANINIDNIKKEFDQ